jgi:ribonuclease Z
MEYVGRSDPLEVDIRAFDATTSVTCVWDDDGITVDSITVRHPPMSPCVAYRVNTDEGSVVISGDTVVCPEIEDLAQGVDILVHSVIRNLGTAPVGRFSIHADSRELGAMAQRLGVPTLMLTHLIPPPRHEGDLAGFVKDVREAGYSGNVVIGADLIRYAIGGLRHD